MIVMLIHARKGRGTVQGLEEKRAKVPWVLEEVSLYCSPWRPPRLPRRPPVHSYYHKGGTHVGVCPDSTIHSSLKFATHY